MFYVILRNLLSEAYLTHSLPMHPFSTPWKHQKNLTVFWCFHGVEKWCIGNEWVKTMSTIYGGTIFVTISTENIWKGPNYASSFKSFVVQKKIESRYRNQQISNFESNVFFVKSSPFSD